MSLSPGTPIGKYLVRRKLAEGGMAEIYLCDVQGPEGFEKEVVIKRVRSFLASDPSFVQMFIAEARVASRLNHPNLVQIFDFDKHEDTYYLAMEYVRGHSLWDLRRRAKERMIPMPPTLVAHIGAAVARGLYYAHRLTDRGQPLELVHRDVTPHNVLLSYDGAIKLTDFGIAKAGNKLTSPGMLKGKFAYMAPEQARGDEVDARTDLFALGIVLWEMLTGGRLFDGDSDVAVLRSVQESVIPPPARLNPDVPAELDAVITKALQRDPVQRFQTAQEMERALTQVVLGNARSAEDTDVGHYIAQVFEGEPPADESEDVPLDLGSGSGPVSGAPPKREPTAVMRKSSPSRPAAPPSSPDEDAHGSTAVIDRSKPRKPGATPTGYVLSGTPPPAPAPLEPAPVPAPERPTPAPPPPAPITTAPLEVPKPAPRRRASGLFVVGALILVVGGAAVARIATSSRSSEKPEALSTVDAGRTEPVTTALPTEREPVTDEGAPTKKEPVADEGASAVVADAGTNGPAPARGGEVQATAADSAPAPAEYGFLTIRVVPWGTIFLDSEWKGELTGSKRYRLKVGTHQVRVVHKAVRKKAEVTIRRANDQQSLDFDLFAR